MKNKLTLLFLTLTFSCIALGQMVEEQGIGRINYEGRFSANASDKKEAFDAAKLNALQTLVAGFDTAKQMEYANVRLQVESNLDLYVPNLMVLDEATDKKSRTYTVVGRASINLGLIEAEIGKSSAVQSVSEGERSILTFVFLSRKAVSVKQFDDKVSRRADQTVVEEASETQAMDGSTVSISGENYSSVSTVTGGSREIKADKISYDVSSSDDINTTVMETFGNAGYDVVEAEMVADETAGQMDLDAFIYDFSQGDDISASTRKSAANGCRDLDIRYLAIGKLDIGQNMRDPVTGLVRVYVNVNAKVYDVSKRFPRTVAGVGPVQYSGMGPTQDVAQRNALQQAGEQASAELVSQMRSKNLY